MNGCACWVLHNFTNFEIASSMPNKFLFHMDFFYSTCIFITVTIKNLLCNNRNMNVWNVARTNAKTMNYWFRSDEEKCFLIKVTDTLY